MQYFVDPSGNYLGGYDEESLAKVPAGAVEIPTPPGYGTDIYDAIGGTWDTSARPTSVQKNPHKTALIKILQKLQVKFPAEAAEYQPYIDALNQEG